MVRDYLFVLIKLTREMGGGGDGTGSGGGDATPSGMKSNDANT